MNTPNKPMRTWWTWAGVFVACVAISVAGRTYTDQLVNRELPPLTPSQLAEAKASATVTALVTRQSSDGVTVENFDQQFLDNLGAWLAGRVNSKDPGQSHVPEGVYLEVGGKKLAVIRLRTHGVTPNVSITGIEGDQVVRVTCVSDMLFDVPVTTGQCADKINEAFGVSFSVADGAR